MATSNTDWWQAFLNALTQVGTAWAQAQGSQTTQQVAAQTAAMQKEIEAQQKQTQVFMLVGLGILAVLAFTMMRKG